MKLSVTSSNDIKCSFLENKSMTPKAKNMLTQQVVKLLTFISVERKSVYIKLHVNIIYLNYHVSLLS